MTEYNGYANYETWAMSLWLHNSLASQQWLTDQAEECLTEVMDLADHDLSLLAAHNLADRLRDTFADAMPLLDDMWGDLLTHAYQQVDWDEIACHSIDLCREG